MEPKLKTSFIPDKMPQSSKKNPLSSGVKTESFDILVIVAIAVFVASVALAIGVFLYDNLQSAQLEAKRKQLAQEKKLLNPSSVKLLARLDKRLKVASEVLANHTAPSAVFDLLEALTLKSVYFKDFEYTNDTFGTIAIKMRGVAKSVNGVARQAEVFGQNRAFINPIFSNLNISDDGVEFDVKTNIDKNVVSYSQVIQSKENTEMGGFDQGVPSQPTDFSSPPSAPNYNQEAPSL